MHLNFLQHRLLSVFPFADPFAVRLHRLLQKPAEWIRFPHSREPRAPALAHCRSDAAIFWVADGCFGLHGVFNGGTSFVQEFAKSSSREYITFQAGHWRFDVLPAARLFLDSSGGAAVRISELYPRAWSCIARRGLLRLGAPAIPRMGSGLLAAGIFRRARLRSRIRLLALGPGQGNFVERHVERLKARHALGYAGD